MDDPEREVPPSLKRLWGQGTPGRRGPKAGLTVDQIVRAAVEIADGEGLAAVSMARIGQSLGCSAMALYRHVSNKDELFALMADAVAGDLAPPTADGDWRTGLEAWTRAQIEGLIARPWFLELPIASARPGPSRVRWVERAFAILRDVDLTVEEKLQVIGLLSQHVLGEGRVQVETRRAAAAAVRRDRGLPADTPESELDPRAVDEANPYHDFEAVLLHLADPDAYPHLFAALTATPGDQGPPAALVTQEDDIGFGLDIVLDGIAAFIDSRTGSPD